MHPKIIGIVGDIRAGKTTVSKYLCDRYGYAMASNSEILSDILGYMNIRPERGNLSQLGNAIFSVLGNDAIAHFRMRQGFGDGIVVDGIRYAEELSTYSEEPSFMLLAVSAPPELRFERAALKGGGVKDPGIRKETFLQLQDARSERDIPALMREAHASVVNDGSVDDLYRQIDDLFHSLT